MPNFAVEYKYMINSMKCPKCNSEAVEVKIPLFDGFDGVGIVCRGFDPFSFVAKGAKKIKLALQDKKLYVCTNEKCGYKFEK